MAATSTHQTVICVAGCSFIKIIKFAEAFVCSLASLRERVEERETGISHPNTCLDFEHARFTPKKTAALIELPQHQ
jgi:hypothetical protein